MVPTVDQPLASDILHKKVSVIESNATVKEAAEKMRKNKTRELIVVSGRDAVGILVDRDITFKVVAENKNPEETKVKDIMSVELVTASETDKADEIARAMVKNGISRVPVVRGEQLVGLITYRDILRMWPGYVDILKEELNIVDEASTSVDDEIEGICASCENFSTQLRNQDGILLCPECYES